MSVEDSHDVDIELDDDGALDIYEDTHIITYMKIGEVLVGLTSKEHD
jgi:hypothetical protein